MENSILSLLQKYDVPTPRYTSYPTVPYWEPSTIDAEKWKKSVVDTFTAENGELSIYIHLPFCENLCTFCACNKRITKNHKVEDPYIATVLKEWEMYRSIMPLKPIIREIHLGGGTPTFFSPYNLEVLINGITRDCTIAEGHEFSIEVHPNYTTEEHLSTLAALGFNRISVGVQDFDPVVQFVINRIQSFEKTKEVVDWARKHGFNSVNVDLVYGLPKQTLSSVEHTIRMIRQIMPDRIAFYSYAHVPWKSKVQRRYTEADLPKAEQKLEMYTKGSGWLKEAGFTSIGMDHFALPADKLLTAAARGMLHRNFMGYTTTQTKLIIALGASSISDSWNAFIQNEKEVEAYQDKISRREFPIINGHLLSSEDVILRRNILDLMCKGRTTLDAAVLDAEFMQAALEKLRDLESDGLIEMDGYTIVITAKGGTFIRNISAVIDARLWRNTMGVNVFSKAI